MNRILVVFLIASCKSRGCWAPGHHGNGTAAAQEGSSPDLSHRLRAFALSTARERRDADVHPRALNCSTARRFCSRIAIALNDSLRLC